MKQYQVYYCAGPENLEICMNNIDQVWANADEDVQIQIIAHCGCDPRYTVITCWLPKKEEGVA